MSVLRYISHPQVMIDPDTDVMQWTLNATGHARITALCASAPRALAGTVAIYASPERKARDSAAPLAQVLGLSVQIAQDSFENDRSSTGFLPPAEFETVADQFFANPNDSIRGWERAIDAQTRIVSSMESILNASPAGDVLVVGHGAVGTLLYCAYSSITISREHDQGPGGGNMMVFDRKTRVPLEKWKQIETLIQD